MKRKPTRRDLIVIIGRLQNMIGAADAANNDRNPNRQAQAHDMLLRAMDLCITARGFDPPIEDSGPWGEKSDPRMPTKKIV